MVVRDSRGRFVKGSGGGGAGVTGAKELTRRLAAKGLSYSRAVAGALYLQGSQIMAKSVQLVPVDTGRLRSTAYVDAPQHSITSGWGIKLGYATDYAVPVHERTEIPHRVGQAKYLEAAIDEYRPGMPERIAAWVTQLERQGAGFGMGATRGGDAITSGGAARMAARRARSRRSRPPARGGRR